MPKNQSDPGKKLEKGGYQPLNEGYQATGESSSLSQLPQGGSGESSKQGSTSNNDNTGQ